MISFTEKDLSYPFVFWTLGYLFGIVLLPLGIIGNVYEMIRRREFNKYRFMDMFFFGFRIGILISVIVSLLIAGITQKYDEICLKILFKLKIIK